MSSVQIIKPPVVNTVTEGVFKQQLGRASTGGLGEVGQLIRHARPYIIQANVGQPASGFAPAPGTRS